MDIPFHRGELEVQERLGVRTKVEPFGRHAIRDFMPDEHREFFARLRFFLVGWLDGRGWPWASLLVGEPGFLSTPDARHLRVAAGPLPGDELRAHLRVGAALGGLGIELETRRRNRVNGKIAAVEPDGAGFTLQVDQSFGNCKQYIQARRVRAAASAGPAEAPGVGRSAVLDAAARSIVARADTFFIASQFGDDEARREHGVDVSHRGGRPGFVAIEDERTLLFPDFRGNFLFNTLGNLQANPRCGLLFVDFASRDALQIGGAAEILWQAPASLGELPRAERALRVRIDEVVYLTGVVPLAWDFLGYARELERPAPSAG